MRKTLLAAGILTLGFTAAVSAQAALPLIQPKLDTPVIKTPTLTATTTSSTTINPNIKPQLINPNLVDPALLTPTTTQIPTPKPLPIDPSKFGNLQPLPIQPITIPPELLKGPTISNVALSTDGKVLRVVWTTSRVATTQVDYGTSASYGQTLSDKTLTTSHEALLAVAPGDLHLKLTSVDSLNRKSETPDITAAIPSVTTQTQPEETATTTTPTQETVIPPTQVQQDKTSQAQTGTQTQTSASSATGMSPTEAFLIGLAVLLVIIIIILLVSRRKRTGTVDEVKR